MHPYSDWDSLADAVITTETSSPVSISKKLPESVYSVFASVWLASGRTGCLIFALIFLRGASLCDCLCSPSAEGVADCVCMLPLSTIGYFSCFGAQGKGSSGSSSLVSSCSSMLLPHNLACMVMSRLDIASRFEHRCHAASIRLSKSSTKSRLSFLCFITAGRISTPKSRIMPTTKLYAWSHSKMDCGAHGMKKQAADQD